MGTRYSAIHLLKLATRFSVTSAAISAVLAGTTSCTIAHADVNVKDASFSTTFIDLDLGHLKITRTYNSRSTYSGVFGYGWCSNLDQQLQKSGEDLVIATCDRKQVFHRDHTSPALRWITGRLSDGTLEADGDDIIHRDSQGREFERFAGAPSGGGGDSSRIRLFRDAATGEGMRVRLETDPVSHKILKIWSPGSEGASYEYNGDDLIKVKNAWKNTYDFTYDKLHNLTQVAYPDHTFEVMSYDTDSDRITSFQGRNSCIERYDYHVSSSRSHKRQETIATKTCRGQDVSRVAFEFKFAQAPHNTWLLAALKLTRDNGPAQNIRFNLKTGEAL